MHAVIAGFLENDGPILMGLSWQEIGDFGMTMGMLTKKELKTSQVIISQEIYLILLEIPLPLSPKM